MDRMDELIAAAVRQGFTVRQTKRGAWVFYRGTVTVTAAATPEKARDWITLIGALRGAGLVFPQGK